MSTNYGRLCEARDKAHPMTPDTMIEIRAIDLHAVLVNYAVMAEKMEALQSANKDLMAHFEAARADAEKWEARFGVVNEQRAMARETLLDLRHDLREQAERTESSEAAMFRYFHGIVDDLLGFSDVEQWDAVHEALGKPGKLVESKAEASRKEADRLRAEIAEHMQLTREAVEQCDVLRARIAELERQPIRWLPIEEAPKDKDVFLWSRHLGDAFSGSWHSKFGWVDSQYNKLPNVTHFAEIVGPDGEQ